MFEVHGGYTLMATASSCALVVAANEGVGVALADGMDVAWGVAVGVGDVTAPHAAVAASATTSALKRGMPY